MSCLRFTSVLLALSANVAAASEADPPLLSTGLEADPVVEALVHQALARRPELNAARARLVAERHRATQVGAWPDPTLSIDLQNDGFERIEIGTMETSYVSIMVNQPIPFPGKLSLRQEVADSIALALEPEIRRAELSTRAAVQRAYVDLLLARGELELLGEVELLWQQAEEVARIRYEVGSGSQADLLRAQLERSRTRQRRLSLEANERTARHNLNRLGGHDLDAPLPTPTKLADLGEPSLPDAAELLNAARAQSPELAIARVRRRGGEAGTALALRERWPDFGVRAGIMPRGGLPPMWLVGVDIGLPIFAGSKQFRAVDESTARAEAEHAEEEALDELLALRIAERLSLLTAARATQALYRGGLLVQSAATVSSALGQYQVGKIPFSAVLEAVSGHLGDRSGDLGSRAQALVLAIELRALSLDPPGSLDPGMADGTAMGGSGGAAGVTRRGGSSAPTGPAQTSSTPTMGGM